MKIRKIYVSVFELESVNPLIDLNSSNVSGSNRWHVNRGINQNWWHSNGTDATEEIHLMHVLTDTGIEGICTVGDVRYRVITKRALEQLRALAIGEDIADRVLLDSKLHHAGRFAFLSPGWAGAFDNCLWDIAGKAEGLPVCDLIGRVRTSCPAYYNADGNSIEEVIDSCKNAIGKGFSAIKDHFSWGVSDNPRWFVELRKALGSQIELMHDAAENCYTYSEAVRIGHVLEEQDFKWFEEPLSDRDQLGLQRLRKELKISIAGAETLMHDRELCAQWLLTDTVDILRANARHGVTPLLRLSNLAAKRGVAVELNGPGGLFGIVHAHLCCAIPNTHYYEYFPGGSRDMAGVKIGLTNPPLPLEGSIVPPCDPGWGATWDWKYLRSRRIATF